MGDFLEFLKGSIWTDLDGSNGPYLLPHQNHHIDRAQRYLALHAFLVEQRCEASGWQAHALGLLIVIEQEIDQATIRPDTPGHFNPVGRLQHRRDQRLAAQLLYKLIE